MSEEIKTPTPGPTPVTPTPTPISTQQPAPQSSTPAQPSPLSSQQPPTPTQPPQQKPPTKSNLSSLKISLLMYLLGIISGIALTLAFPKMPNDTQSTQPNPTPIEKMTLPTATPLPITPTVEASNSAMQETTPESSPSAAANN